MDTHEEKEDSRPKLGTVESVSIRSLTCYMHEDSKKYPSRNTKSSTPAVFANIDSALFQRAMYLMELIRKDGIVRSNILPIAIYAEVSAESGYPLDPALIADHLSVPSDKVTKALREPIQQFKYITGEPFEVPAFFPTYIKLLKKGSLSDVNSIYEKLIKNQEFVTDILDRSYPQNIAAAIMYIHIMSIDKDKFNSDVFCKILCKKYSTVTSNVKRILVLLR